MRGEGQGEEVDEELEEVSGGTVDEDKEIDVDGEEEEEEGDEEME